MPLHGRRGALQLGDVDGHFLCRRLRQCRPGVKRRDPPVKRVAVSSHPPRGFRPESDLGQEVRRSDGELGRRPPSGERARKPLAQIAELSLRVRNCRETRTILKTTDGSGDVKQVSNDAARGYLRLCQGVRRYLPDGFGRAVPKAGRADVEGGKQPSLQKRSEQPANAGDGHKSPSWAAAAIDIPSDNSVLRVSRAWLSSGSTSSAHWTTSRRTLLPPDAVPAFSEGVQPVQSGGRGRSSTASGNPQQARTAHDRGESLVVEALGRNARSMRNSSTAGEPATSSPIGKPSSA